MRPLFSIAVVLVLNVVMHYAAAQMSYNAQPGAGSYEVQPFESSPSDTWQVQPAPQEYYGTVPGMVPVIDDCVIDEPYVESNSGLPPGARAGIFQKANVGVMWMPRIEDDSLGVTQAFADLVFGFPMPNRESPLLVTPAYSVQFLDGPDFVDIPSRVHDVSLDFHHFRKINDAWTFDAAVTVGLYADDHSFSADDALRVSGRALGIYENSPHTKWIVGVVYLNRAGTSILPAAGLIYSTDDLSYELIFPKPRIAWRTWSSGPAGCDERWWYVAGEFGGGIWAVERAAGGTDTLSYSDYRVMIGTERKIAGGLSRRWEVGYVFGRELEYDSVAGDIQVDDSLFIRTGWAF